MKSKSFLLLSFVTLIASAFTALAVDESSSSTWHAQTIYQAIANMLVFAAAGLIAAIIGFKLFDVCTPGSLTKEIFDNKNIAAAIVSAAVILGVCIIVAAAMFS